MSIFESTHVIHPQTLIELTLAQFPLYDRASVSISPVVKGGSDRKYFRIRAGDASLIAVAYGDGREENRHYVSIARYLAGLGVRVPEVFIHDEEARLIWMEDLGETDLWTHRNDSWPDRRMLYQRAIEQAARLHDTANVEQAVAELPLQIEFNEELYRWEQEYFFEHCAGRILGLADTCDRAPLIDIAARLASLPRVLVHRDFQSQNILIRDGEAHLIDFQGLRPGVRQYDLASLLYDPYVSLTPAERTELLAHYCEPDAEFLAVLDLCAAQRLMQALGAYGFLGHERGLPHFLEHVEPALASLKEVIARVPELGGLARMVA